MTTTTASRPATTGKALHYSLWGVQVLLGLAFTMAGFMKVSTPFDQLMTQIPWVPAVGEAMARFIGLSELLGGIGMIVPAATRILPRLTGFAGLGLATVMLLASLFHLTRGEFGALPINFVLGGLAAFVAWGRLMKAPIAPR